MGSRTHAYLRIVGGRLATLRYPGYTEIGSLRRQAS